MSERSLQGVDLHLWRGDRHVLRGVHFTLGAGECLQVTGPNGTGKTSLLRTVCGLAYPEEGRVLWSGRDTREDLRAYHRHLAYLGHDAPLKPDLTPRENLRYWIGVRRAVSAVALDAALGEVGAGEWRDRPVRTLSAGQKRRAALAGLLLSAAPLWLLDEPTTNLDTAGQALVSGLIARHLARGGLVMAAVHHELRLPTGTLRALELAP